MNFQWLVISDSIASGDPIGHTTPSKAIASLGAILSPAWSQIESLQAILSVIPCHQIAIASLGAKLSLAWSPIASLQAILSVKSKLFKFALKQIDHSINMSNDFSARSSIPRI